MKVTRHKLSIKPRRNTQNGDCIRHQELEEKIKRVIGQLKALPLNGTDYVTYAMKERIREVGKPDTEVPFYVGQTNDLGKRSLEHFQRGGQPTKDVASVYWRMHQILKAYRVPVFEVLERMPTLATSLLSESRWVQTLRSDGFQIWNQWTEHQPGKFSGGVPTKRLWHFTLRQALMDDLHLTVACKQCALTLPLPIAEVAKIAPLSTRLYELRESFKCPRCGINRCLRLGTYRSLSGAVANKKPAI